MEERIARIRKLSGAARGVVWAIQAVLFICFVAGLHSFIQMSGQMRADLAVQGVANLVGIAGAVWVLVLVGYLLGNLQTGDTPFVPDNVRRLRHIGGTLMGLAVVLFVSDVVRSVVYTEVAMFQQPAQGQVVAQRGVAFSYLPLVMVVVGLAVLCVALAFEHGTLLQQQSDETL